MPSSLLLTPAFRPWRDTHYATKPFQRLSWPPNQAVKTARIYVCAESRPERPVLMRIEATPGAHVTSGRKIPRSCRPQIAALHDSVLDKLAKPVFPRPRVLLPESRPPYVPNRKNIPANGAEPGSKSRFQFRCWRDAPLTHPALRRE